MPDVRTTTRNILVAGAGLAVLFVLAQVAELAELAGAIHPWFGVAVAAGLLLAIGWLVAGPAVTCVRLRPALVPPDHVGSPTRAGFVAAYLEEWRRNPRLVGRSLDGEEDLEAALEVLTGDAERIANRYASQVFVGTRDSRAGTDRGEAVVVDATCRCFVRARRGGGRVGSRRRRFEPVGPLRIGSMSGWRGILRTPGGSRSRSRACMRRMSTAARASS